MENDVNIEISDSCGNGISGNGAAVSDADFLSADEIDELLKDFV